MSEKNKILLLDLIEKGKSANIKKLTREGLSFKEISNLTESLVEEDLIEYHEQKIVLTSKGIELLKEKLSVIKITRKENWIEKENKSKVPKLEKNSIFLPSQDELHF